MALITREAADELELEPRNDGADAVVKATNVGIEVAAVVLIEPVGAARELSRFDYKSDCEVMFVGPGC